MNYLDIVIIALITGAFFLGAILGVVRLVFYLLGLLLGAVAASYIDASLGFSPLIRGVMSISSWILISFSSGAVGWMIQKKLRNIGVTFLDRLWGALFSAISVSFAVTVALSHLKVLFPPSALIIESSPVAEFLFSISRAVFSSLNK
ncbi:CvpA family protein [candidate division WOR-3 bacterium]|nr:CvpA family protein [candidate division WOR-3 bacterium]